MDTTMRQFVKDAGRWRPIWPGENGNVRAIRQTHHSKIAPDSQLSGNESLQAEFLSDHVSA
jgi:hypothetical protein